MVVVVVVPGGGDVGPAVVDPGGLLAQSIFTQSVFG